MNIEQTIEQVEKLYQSVTGQKIPTGEIRHSFNPTIDPIALLESRVQQLTELLQDPQVALHMQPWTPPMSVWESSEKILVRLDLPQVSKEDIDITIHGNTLFVSGIRRNLLQESGFIPRMSEKNFGPFMRALVLPMESVNNDIDSKLQDGVLEISLPMKGAVKSSVKKSNAGKSVQ